ncbi:MAG: (2Fe-2S) ferredoxin domain-containing protein [Chloroflexi bacterium]|nr:(2Fe-2S) ferredoxin domain-containing protein [Chloroflexota bacterium]
MAKIQSLEDLDRFREEVTKERQSKAALGQIQIIVGLGSCGIAAGALDTLRAVHHMIEDNKLRYVSVSETGCIGLCRHEPILVVVVGDSPRVTYGRVTPDVARQVIRGHVIDGRIVEEFVIESIPYPTI